MSEGVEKSLVVGGALVSLGIGGLAGFWPAVLTGGILLFGVSLLILFFAMTHGGGAG